MDKIDIWGMAVATVIIIWFLIMVTYVTVVSVG